MANNYFNFKQFTIQQEKSSFKVGTDGVLLGASAIISGVNRVLDIGTGTGLLAIMLAQRCEAEIVAIEPDHESYLEACINVSLCKWNSRIKVENTTLQEYNPLNTRFDLIITNPPFFSNFIKNPNPRKSYTSHDDSLFSSDILNFVSGLLNDEGQLQLILPYVEGNIFIAEAGKHDLYCNKVLKIRPLPTAEIRRLILTFSRRRIKTTEKFLTIEHGPRHEFTEEYKNLTKDYYLKF
jgi:tRNA1Val (adenine37-N6)-methyltransferase